MNFYYLVMDLDYIYYSEWWWWTGGILVNVLTKGTTKTALNGQWNARKSPLTLWNGLLII